MRNHLPDRKLIIVIFLLLGVGLIALASASTEISREHFDKPYYYFFHQLVLGIGVGLLGFFIAQKISYLVWKKWALALLGLSLITLVLVLIPGIGTSSGGASRWLDLKFFSFQPSEFVKLGFLIYLAAWLTKKKGAIKELSQGLVPFLIITAVVVLLIYLQPDIGTLIMIAMIGAVVFFSAGAKLTHVLMIALIGLILLFSFIKIAPYRMNRFLVFLHPEVDPLGISYQINQSKLAIGSGGVFGVGIGHSRQKYAYLPAPASDSIFAIAAEELGFIGSSFIIFLFVFLAWRGLRVAKRSPDQFAKLVAVGITFWLSAQAFINIGAVCGLIPLTGITMPFVSYGSSSMIASLFAAGILVNISKHTIQNKS